MTLTEQLHELEALMEGDSPLRALQRKLKAAGWVGRRSELGARHTYTNRESNDSKWDATLVACRDYAHALNEKPVSHVRAGEIEFYISRTKGDTSRPHLYAILGTAKKDGYDPGFLYIDPEWPAVRKRRGSR